MSLCLLKVACALPSENTMFTLVAVALGSYMQVKCSWTKVQPLQPAASRNPTHRRTNTLRQRVSWSCIPECFLPGVGVSGIELSMGELPSGPIS